MTPAWLGGARRASACLFIGASIPSPRASGAARSLNSTAEWIQNVLKIPSSQYQTLVAQFDPEQFDARRWVRIAKDAGMKYIVITSKHHDGFGLFPSSLTDWCIKSTPFKRDPLRELAAACKAEGIRLCFYYSILDWHHPDWGQREPWNDTATGAPDMDRYTAYMKGQLSELITNYHPAVLWFDGEWESPWTHDRGVDLYDFLRKLDPKLIINNRIDKARKGMEGMNQQAAVGDFGTPEQTIPANGFGPGVDWETCMTMNDTWGYNKRDNHWKSPQTTHSQLDQRCQQRRQLPPQRRPDRRRADSRCFRFAPRRRRPMDEGEWAGHLWHVGQPLRNAIALGTLHQQIFPPLYCRAPRGNEHDGTLRRQIFPQRHNAVSAHFRLARRRQAVAARFEKQSQIGPLAGRIEKSFTPGPDRRERITDFASRRRARRHFLHRRPSIERHARGK